jgi:hypothetical protein
LTWNELRHLHRNPRVVAAWIRLFGPVLRRLTPSRRRLLLGLGSFVILGKLSIKWVRDNGVTTGPPPATAASLLVVLLVLVYVFACYLAARRFASLPPILRSRPLVVLHASFWALLAVLWIARPANPLAQAALAGLAMAMPFLLWRLGYLLLSAQRGGVARTGFLDHALYLWPVWGGTNTPYGKGLDYLRTCEAANEEALARSQLAGVKLFVLALVFAVAHRAFSGLVFGADNAVREALGGATLGIPTVTGLLVSEPGAHPLWVRWATVYAELVYQVLKLAASGHLIVAYLRLCGFNAFRNTYKPLLAESVVEFWNRYYYYFKELLVQQFFFPAFVRYFKRQPRLRLFTAVFASAFFGNVYYHAILEPSLRQGDWAALTAVLVPRTSYCLLLALGIYISMRREQSRTGARSERPWYRRAMAIFGVWTFYALIRLWHHGNTTLLDRAKHTLAMAGLY